MLQDGGGGAHVKVHDVSLVMRLDMPTWPGEDGPRVTPLRRIAKGDSANVSIVTFGNHTGTHVDPPVHFIEGAATVDQLPLDALVGPCRVLAFDGPRHITAEWLDRADVPSTTERILFKTRNSERWREPVRPFDRDFVALDRTAAGWCVERRLKLVGIDYLSIEPQGPEKEGYPTHKQLLGAKIVIIEGLDLKDVRPGDYELACGAIKFEGGDGAPARVFLIER
jgi:arylformamidase